MSAARLYIYRNLRTGGFSIKHLGRVIDRDNLFIAEDVSFKVNEKGRQKVLLEKQKNIHAYVVCDKYTYCERVGEIDILGTITYNPYTAAHFTCNGKAITEAKTVLFENGKCYLVAE